MSIDDFINLYLKYGVMVQVHNQEQKTDAARKIAEITGISDDDMAPYNESSPLIGKRSGFMSGSYGFKGKSDITIDYKELIEMIESFDNSLDGNVILGLL